MITSTRRRRPAAFLTAAAVAAGALLLPALPAAAADGPAPQPREHRLLQDIHTDAISTFLENGQLSLGTKADVPEGNGTRFAADDVWFHVDHDARMTAPAGIEFVAPAGAEIWLAPMTQNPETIWPGFSTESVPNNAIDGNNTTFRLVDVEGPGKFELFTFGSFGQPNRLWSSTEDLKSFTVQRTHMHANWAFTAPGIYRITIEGLVTIGGIPSTSTATYTFVVGDAPVLAETSVALETSATDLVLGDPLTLDATVEPAAVDGFVEFRAGGSVIGHERVADGRASLTVPQLGVGVHAITAAFVPETLNLATASVSAPVQVTVTEEAGGDVFAIRGIAEAYAPGGLLTARVVGATLDQGEEFEWLIRPIGASHGGDPVTGTGTDASAGRLELPVDISHDGFELSVRLLSGDPVEQQTVWVPIEVTPAAQAVTAVLETATPTYLGDPSVLAIDGAPGEGESLQLVLSYGGLWYPTPDGVRVEGSRIVVDSPFAFTGEWAVQTVRDGVAVAQSAPIAVEVREREVLIAGVQGVYRDGATLRATGEVYPQRDDLYYVWQYMNLNTDPWTNRIVKEGSGAEALSVEMPLTVADDDGMLFLIAHVGDAAGPMVGQTNVPVLVSDADPDTQLFFFQGLSGHYHQGGAIDLVLAADPALAEGDTVAWDWRWPGQEWTTVPGASGLKHRLTAEQALDGVEVRATLAFAGGGEPIVAEPVTIHVDDHGAAPRQKLSITGLAEQYTAGDEVTLDATVTPASVIDRYDWFVQRAGESTPMLVEDQHDSTLTFAATEDLDGAAVFARLTLPDGTPYVESTPVSLNIVEAPPVETEITVSGLEESYTAGDALTLTAAQDPDTGEDHWHWFIRAAGSEEFVVIPGQATATLTRTVSEADDGAAIIARLYGHDHAVIGESEPVVLNVEPVDPGPGPGEPGPDAKPTGAPAPRTAADVDGYAEGGLALDSATVKQGQVLTVGLGEERAGEWTAAWLLSTPTLLGGDWAQADSAGALTVRIPEDAEVGAHRLAVFDAEGELVGWASLTVTAADGTVPTGTLAQTGGELRPELLVLPLLFGVIGTLLLLRRRASTR
ncbi:surface-anchored protein [Diaminobutyricimonas aerilata]|uniref:Surface-anchored protein n=1 Tax=Diaminobutyricimonas aerilata TaxID=1162967 RepID=A0A2M9CM80_9MICO|nr:choice-of-anchor M domain-containing protein [Diaminobutyricimonas aerilata]PJJ73002.1 surface-anchored protein [Diaminobutyricimonas aerilata]